MYLGLKGWEALKKLNNPSNLVWGDVYDISELSIDRYINFTT